MKIINYNISQCTQAKIDAIMSQKADIYILPENADKQHITLPDGFRMIWTGDDDCCEKGLAVIWHERLSLYLARNYTKIPHILPILIEGAGFPKFLLASWPTTRGTKKSYHYYSWRH